MANKNPIDMIVEGVRLFPRLTAGAAGFAAGAIDKSGPYDDDRHNNEVTSLGIEIDESVRRSFSVGALAGRLVSWQRSRDD